MKQENELLDEYRKSGDLRLLGKLYEPYMPLLYGVCFRYYKDQGRSEDAVMQIFESLITKLRQHEITNFKSWLYTFARNHCLMDLRKDKKVTLVDIDDYLGEINAAVSPLTFANRDEVGDSATRSTEKNLRRMEDCLTTLSDEQQTCVKMFYLEQKCYQDIAHETGYPMNKVKSYIQNGKRNLKICMEREAHG